jgi:hypothetical protein
MKNPFYMAKKFNFKVLKKRVKNHFMVQDIENCCSNGGIVL